jgi:hypothetical protein
MYLMVVQIATIAAENDGEIIINVFYADHDIATSRLCRHYVHSCMRNVETKEFLTATQHYPYFYRYALLLISIVTLHRDTLFLAVIGVIVV